MLDLISHLFGHQSTFGYRNTKVVLNLDSSLNAYDFTDKYRCTPRNHQFQLNGIAEGSYLDPYFLATLVALHFTPVSDSVSGSQFRVAAFQRSLELASLFQKRSIYACMQTKFCFLYFVFHFLYFVYFYPTFLKGCQNFACMNTKVHILYFVFCNLYFVFHILYFVFVPIKVTIQFHADEGM